MSELTAAFPAGTNDDSSDVATLATGVGLMFGGRILGRTLRVLSQVVLARLLGPVFFGMYAIGWALLSIVGLVAMLGLDNGVIRYATRYWHSDPPRLKGVLVQSLGIAVLAGLLSGCIIYFASPYLASALLREPRLEMVFRWLAPLLGMYVGVTVAAAACRVSKQAQYSIMLEDLIPPAVNLLLVLIFLLMDWGLWGAMLALVVSYGVSTSLIIPFFRRLYPAIFAPRITAVFISPKELMSFALPTSLAIMSGTLMLWADRLLLSYFRPAGEVGIYQAAAQLSALFPMLLSAIVAIFSPMIADLHQRQERAQLNELFKISTKWALYASVPLFLTICFTSRDLMVVVFGPQYAEGATALVILATTQLINAGTGAVGFLLMLTGQQNRWFSISALWLAVDLILNWLLIPALGITGAALATGIAVSGMFIVGLFEVKRSLTLWPYDRRYIKGGVAAVAAVGLMLILGVVAKLGSPVLNLLSMLVTSLGVFTIVLVLLGLDDEDRQFINALRARALLPAQR